METKLKAVVGESSIVLRYRDEIINIQRCTDNLLYEELRELLKLGDATKVVTKFLEVKERINKYTNKNFEVRDRRLYIKGDNTPLPENITKKLLELEKSGEDFMPLIRFWKKLKTNPSKESIEQLYGFMLHNNIGLDETGNIVVEKGVQQREGAPVGELVDCHTGCVDNSIGMEVSMAREDVDDNPERTCSHGLHVGAPDYVRQYYSNKIIVQCLVNPRDVVSVPTDYNNTKMRVCRYVVAGYSEKSEYKPIYAFDDFLKTPPEVYEIRMKGDSERKEVKRGEDKKVTSKKALKVKVCDKAFKKYIKQFTDMKAKDVVKFIDEEFGIKLEYNIKSKASIVQAAAKIVANSEEIRKDINFDFE